MAAKLYIPSDKTKKVKDKKSSNILGLPYYMVLTVLTVIPFLIMILYAFSSSSESIFNIKFSLNNFQMFFSEKLFIKAMLESLYLAAMSTIATLIIGYPLAYIITQLSSRKQVLFISLITVTMWVNMLLSANALKTLTELIAPSLFATDFIIIVGNVYMFLPYMVLPIYTILSKIDKNLIESSYDLGANPVQTFRKVILPLSLSGVISGSMMVFLPAATTLVIPKYLGAGKRFLIGNLIENKVIQEGNYGYGSAISIVIGLILIGFIILIKRADKYEGVMEND